MIENIPILKSIIEIIKTVLELLKKLFSKDKSIYQVDIPRKTIIVVPDSRPNHNWWHLGMHSNKPAMQVSGRFTVTNITKYKVIPCVVKIKKPEVFGHIEGCINATSTAECNFNFWITPPFKEKGEPLIVDIAIVDQFGNEHWIKGVKFVYT